MIRQALSMNTPMPRKRGRPPKFGRPSEVVALTLPSEVVRSLRSVHPDLAWAIVTLFEKTPRRTPPPAEPVPDAELVAIAERRSLIVVNRATVRTLPGIHIVPLAGDRAFLALEPGRGMADLELAVIDRLDDRALDARERTALRRLRAQLRAWRRDPGLRFATRAIIVVERAPARPGRSRNVAR